MDTLTGNPRHEFGEQLAVVCRNVKLYDPGRNIHRRHRVVDLSLLCYK
jgi:hypothetical protein